MNSRDHLKHLLDILLNLAVSSGKIVSDVTSNWGHSFAPTELSAWMDTYHGHIGGFYHRVCHGHDFISNVGLVYRKFGAEGLFHYPWELAKDFATTHGIPLPGVELLVRGSKVTAEQATKWMSVSFADMFSGGFAAFGTYRLYEKVKAGNMTKNQKILATIGVAVKIIGGKVTHNPVLILSGVADAVILVKNETDLIGALKSFFPDFFDSRVLGTATGALAAGAFGAAGIYSLTAAFGTASTGSAISALSGAAATKATLAALGGGALSAGGFGIVGGMTVLTGGAALLALGVGYGIYKLLED